MFSILLSAWAKRLFFRASFCYAQLKIREVGQLQDCAQLIVYLVQAEFWVLKSLSKTEKFRVKMLKIRT